MDGASARRMGFRGLGVGCLTVGMVATSTYRCLPAVEPVMGSFLSAGGSMAGESVTGYTAGLGSMGLGLANASGSDVVSTMGSVAALENHPESLGATTPFIGDVGSDVLVSYSDVATLANVRDPDGASLVYEISTSVGALLVDDVEVSLARLTDGAALVWRLPSDTSIESAFLDVIPIDAVVLAGDPVAIGVESASSVSVEVAVGSTVVSDSASVDLGDVEVAASTVTETVTVTNTSSDSATAGVSNAEANGSGFLRRRNVARQISAGTLGRLTISEIALGGSHPEDFVITGITLPLILEPGESASFTITFSPGAFGDRSASISLRRPGSNQGFFSMGFKGRGNRPPEGGDDEVFRPEGLAPFKIRLSDLLANDSDIDGDVVQFGGLSTSASQNGRALTRLDGEWLVYFPGAADETPDDSFVYRVTDGRGATAPAVVRIREQVSASVAGAFEASIQISPGAPVTLSVRGIPGRTYSGQYTLAIEGSETVWVDFGESVSASLDDGSFEIVDPTPVGDRRFYRIIEAQ